MAQESPSKRPHSVTNFFQFSFSGFKLYLNLRDFCLSQRECIYLT